MHIFEGGPILNPFGAKQFLFQVSQNWKLILQESY